MKLYQSNLSNLSIATQKKYSGLNLALIFFSFLRWGNP